MREALRVSWILLRYKWLQSVAQMRLKRKQKKPKAKREATAPKARAGTFGFALIYFFLLSSLTFSHVQTLRRLTDGSTLELMGHDRPIPESLLLPSSVWTQLPEVFWIALGLSLLSFSIGIVLLPMLRVGHATQDNDLEWISTFPVSPRSFFFGRIVQTALMSAFSWFYFIPLCLLLVLMRGGGIGPGLGAAILFCLAVTLSGSSLGQTLDSWVQTRLSPARQRDFRSLVVVLSALTLFQYYLLVQMPSAWYWNWIYDHFAALQQSPWYRLLGAVFAQPRPQLLALLGLVGGTTFLIWASTFLQARMYRQGLAVHSGYERQKPGVKSVSAPFAESWIGRIPVMMRREFQLLCRDRTHLTQVLVGPLAFILISAINKRGGDGPSGHWVLSFMAMVPLMLTTTAATTVMQKENNFLWQYATIPRPLIDVLGDRQKFWTVFALLALGIISIVSLPAQTDLAFWARWLLIPLALVMFQNLSLSLVMFMHEPFDPAPARRPSLRLTYLLMTIAAVLVVTVASAEPWSILVTFSLIFGVTLACRQRLRDYEPYILDPSLSPPAEASLGDGLTAALIYFVLQTSLAFALLGFSFGADAALLWGSLVGGVMTFGLMQWHYARRHAIAVPVYWGAIKPIDAGLMLVFLGATVGFAWVWMQHAAHWEFWKWLSPMPEHVPKAMKPSLALAAFVSIVAPMIEEYIFRGLIFGGMRRRFGLLFSLILSSLIFAFLHPPLSFGPVFLVGVATALLYERTQRLLPGVLLHVFYNVSVLALSWS